MFKVIAAVVLVSFFAGCAPVERDDGRQNARALVLDQDVSNVRMVDSETGEPIILNMQRGSVIYAEIIPDKGKPPRQERPSFTFLP